MGYYIDKAGDGTQLSTLAKARDIINHTADACQLLNHEEILAAVPNLICVVENVTFDAAAWAYSREEAMRFFPRFDDQRVRRWIQVPNIKLLLNDVTLKNYDAILEEP